MSWVYSVLMTLYAVTIIGIIAVILSENRNPVKSLAWVTILLLLPVVGIVLYVFFGRSIKNSHKMSRRNRRKLRRYERHNSVDFRTLPLSHETKLQIKLVRSLTGGQLHQGNTVEVFTNGKDKFDALLKDLEGARSSIHIQYYIIEDDEIGRRVANVLERKVKEGVRVRMIYDHVGSFYVRSRFFKRLAAKGVEVHPFFKVSFPWLGTKINWRNHRKICIVDGRVGYIGGMNIADRYLTGGRFASWRDTHVRVSGPVVDALQYSFSVDWHFMKGEILDTDFAVSVDPVPPIGPGALSGLSMQLVASGPTSQWSNFAMAIHKSIAGARQRVFIQTPYFLPTEGLLRALQSAALAHVDVRLMIPYRSDSRMLTLASASYIAECLRAGIKVYRYKAGMLHSKMIIIDDEITTIGSTNFDFRSFDYNFEANIFVYGKEFTDAMLKVYADDIKSCERVVPARWRKRPIYNKVCESILRLLSPIL